jgi:hypothetical protein
MSETLPTPERPPNPEFHEKLKAAFNLAERRADYVGAISPTPEDFALAGWDSEATSSFQQQYEQMEAAGLKPQVILTMHLPLAPKSADDSLNFRTLFTNMTADKTIPNRPLKNRQDDNKGDGPGLWVDSDVYNETVSSQLYQQEIDLIKQTAEQGNGHYVEIGGIIYTLSIIPGTDRPQDLGTSHTANQGRHSTPSQLLTQNIDRLLQGEPPVDSQTCTWAYGTFEDGARAVVVDWSPEYGQVYVSWVHVGYSDGSLGARLSVRG